MHMTVRAERGVSWRDVELPVVLRYRKTAFVGYFIVTACLVVGAVACVMLFGRLLAGLPLLISAVGFLFVTIPAFLHVRSLDHFSIDPESVTLVGRDGGTTRIDLTPDLEFSVVYEQCCRSIAMRSRSEAHLEAEHLIADLLDVPKGLTIYGLCELLNDLGRGHSRASAISSRHNAAIRRRQDWYREPARISRSIYLLGLIALGALFLGTIFVLTMLSYDLSAFIAKPIMMIVKFTLSFLFIYPALRFLVVARLRDLGEEANHRNAMGLAWNMAVGGPMRLVLRRGQVGRNQFGPEPRF